MSFETGLRQHKPLGKSISLESKNFVTAFPKAKSKVLGFEPSFLPPITKAAQMSMERLPVLTEKNMEQVRDMGKTEKIRKLRAVEGPGAY